MAREAKIIGHATDAHGQTWDVREARPSGHGWDIYLGWPHGASRGRGCGGVRIIASVELAQYLATTRGRDTALPIGETAEKRLRRELGISWSWDAWWAAREEDLATLTLAAFATKHGCSIGAVSLRRRALRSKS